MEFQNRGGTIVQVTDQPVTVFNERAVFLPKGNNVVSAQALLSFDGLETSAVFSVLLTVLSHCSC